MEIPVGRVLAACVIAALVLTLLVRPSITEDRFSVTFPLLGQEVTLTVEMGRTATGGTVAPCPVAMRHPTGPEGIAP